MNNNVPEVDIVAEGTSGVVLEESSLEYTRTLDDAMQNQDDLV